MKKGIFYVSILAIPLTVVSLGMKTSETEKDESANRIQFVQKNKAGEKIFKQYCATCHQLDGGGVPNIAPPLIQTKYVLGDKNTLIHIVLNGFNEDVEIDNQHFSNPMPPFKSKLSDTDVANVLSYVRSSFGNDASAVTASEVKAIRSGK